MGIRAFVHHSQALGYCNKGVRHFCRLHGLKFSDFVTVGIDTDILEATDDVMAKNVARMAREEEKNGRRWR